MNRIHRLVWNQITNTWVAVAESARSRGKGSSHKLVAATLSLVAAFAEAAPMGGQITTGTGSIVKVGVNTTVTQTSQSLSLNWQSFNIAKQESVNFVQPSATSVAINRISDTTASQIYGNLNANGQVYLINPNGILFGQGSQVNVGALVATTLDLNAANPADTSRSFSGNGLGSVVNHGAISAAPGGFVALLGHTVSNRGSIAAPLGTVALGAGSAVTLSFSGNNLVKMQVDQSMLNALAENGSLIKANGGRVLMSAGANDAVLASVVNNTGVIEAHTVENRAGTITLLAGMAAGTVHVAGTLDASAPQGGNGGFIETSAAHVKIADVVKVTTAAVTGQAGTWLIDPTNFIISEGTAGQTDSGIGATTLQSNLGTTSVSIATSNTGSEPGDINVNAPVAWTANKLTLTAHKNININANLNGSGTASLALGYGQSGNIVTAAGSAISLPAGTSNFTTQQGSGTVKNYTVITTAAQLAAIASTTSYALGTDIDLASAAFTPIAAFSSTFDGLGHTISNLKIAGGASTGLFAEVLGGATIQNVGLVNGTVTGAASTGALVGNMTATTINNSYAKNINVSGNAGTGGLVGTIVGMDSSTINSSHATGNANGNGGAGVGGLVGSIAGAGGAKNISNSYATGTVDGAAGTGGLVGSIASPGDINNSYATGAVSGNSAGGAGTGGLVGSLAGSGSISNSYAMGRVKSSGAATGGLVGSTANSGTISNSCAAGDVQGDGAGTGGLVGSSAASGNISDSYATGNIMSVAAGTGGLVGSNTSGAIVRSFASGNVNGGGAGTGGLAGSNTLGVISESFAVGKVSGSGYSIAAPGAAATVGASTGGLVGSNSGTISNSYAAGSVEGFAAGVGGLVGDSVGGSITTSYAAGQVTGQTSATGVGGFRGFGTGTVVDTNSYRLANNVTLNGSATAAPTQASTELSSAGLASTGSFVSWAFSNVWKMPAAGTYQYPVLQNLTKTLTLTSSVSKVYDGLAYAGILPTLLASCCINNPGFMTVTSAPLGQVNAGVYNISPTVTPVNSALASYFAVTPVMLTITKATLGLAAVADSKAYDGSVSSTKAVGVSGKATGDTVVATEEFNSKNVDAATMGIKAGYSVKDAQGVDMSGNYNVTTATAVGTITKATLTVTGTTTALDKVYDGNTVASLTGGTLSGVVAADLGDVTFNQTGVFADKNVAGGISVTATETLGGSAAGNYSLIQPTAALRAAIVLGAAPAVILQPQAGSEVVQQVTAQIQENVRALYQGAQPNTLVLSPTLALTQNIGAISKVESDTFVAGKRPASAGDNPIEKDKMTIAVNTRINLNGTGPLLTVVDGGSRSPDAMTKDNE